MQFLPLCREKFFLCVGSESFFVVEGCGKGLRQNRPLCKDSESVSLSWPSYCRQLHCYSWHVGVRLLKEATVQSRGHRMYPPSLQLALTSTDILGRPHDHNIRFDQQRLHIGYLRSPQQSGASPTRVTRKPKSRRFTPSLIIPLLPPS